MLVLRPPLFFFTTTKNVDALQRLGFSYLEKKNRRMVGAPAKKGKKGAPAGKPQPPPPYVGAAAAAAAPAAGLKKDK